MENNEIIIDDNLARIDDNFIFYNSDSLHN